MKFTTMIYVSLFEKNINFHEQTNEHAFTNLFCQNPFVMPKHAEDYANKLIRTDINQKHGENLRNTRFQRIKTASSWRRIIT